MNQWVWSGGCYFMARTLWRPSGENYTKWTFPFFFKQFLEDRFFYSQQIVRLPALNLNVHKETKTLYLGLSSIKLCHASSCCPKHCCFSKKKRIWWLTRCWVQTFQIWWHAIFVYLPSEWQCSILSFHAAKKKSMFGDNIVFSLQLQINDQRFEDAEEMEHDRDSDSGHHWDSLPSCVAASNVSFVRVFVSVRSVIMGNVVCLSDQLTIWGWWKSKGRLFEWIFFFL